MSQNNNGSAWTAIVNVKLVTPHAVVPDGAVLVCGDRIAMCGRRGSFELPDDAVVIDGGGRYLGPGFIDIHCHGGGGHWSWVEPYKFACAHLKFGTTGILPTLTYNESREETMDGVKRILADGVGETYRDVILGIHLEGPYINKKYGAVTSPIRPVDPSEYEALLAVAGEHIKVWTFAPELDGQREFARAASEYGIVLSVGHSEADAETIFSYVRQGLKLGCHTTNASGVTPAITRYAGTREVGVAEAIMVHDDIYAEVIPDAGGVHVRPLMCRLIHKAKGTDRTIIITDAMDESCLPPDPGDPHPDVRFIQGDMLAGSKLTMNRAVRNMMNHAGVGYVDAFRMASLNPARVLKVDHVAGSVEPGKYADLVLATEDLEIERVMFRGRFVE